MKKCPDEGECGAEGSMYACTLECAMKYKKHHSCQEDINEEPCQEENTRSLYGPVEESSL